MLKQNKTNKIRIEYDSSPEDMYNAIKQILNDFNIKYKITSDGDCTSFTYWLKESKDEQ